MQDMACRSVGSSLRRYRNGIINDAICNASSRAGQLHAGPSKVRSHDEAGFADTVVKPCNPSGLSHNAHTLQVGAAAGRTAAFSRCPVHGLTLFACSVNSYGYQEVMDVIRNMALAAANIGHVISALSLL
jgi:hypothetical protein